MNRYRIIMTMAVVLSCMTAFGQSLTEGFYRVQNQASGRYLYVKDCTGEVSTLGVDMGAIQLWPDLSAAVSDPGSVIFLEDRGGVWDLLSQATGVHEITERYMNITLDKNGVSLVYHKGTGQYLYEIGDYDFNPTMGLIGAGTSKEYPNRGAYRAWLPKRIDNSTDNYFGFRPTVTVGNKYYTPFFADFAYTPVSGQKTWYVSKVDKANGIAVVKELEGTVARQQPVIVECKSLSPSDNKVDLLFNGGNPAAGNLLKGVFFDNGDRAGFDHTGKNPAYIEFKPETMRLLGTDAEGKLAFVNSSPSLVSIMVKVGNNKVEPIECLPHNTSYLTVDADCPASLSVMTEAEYDEYVERNKKYTLTYKIDGQEYNSFTYKKGETVTPLAEPTKEGYTFSGWSEIPSTMPAENVEVTGSWSVNSYNLTYYVDDVVYKTLSVDYESAIQPEPAPVKEGYTFSGWSEIPSTMPAKDVDVKGSWKINSYTLKYVVDGEVLNTHTVEYGKTVTPEEEPVKEGYTFSGWSEVPATMPAEDVTVTGTWIINSYTLTYSIDGEVYKTMTVEYGADIIPEAIPVKEGYTFHGWVGIPETMPSGDVTVTGSWQGNLFTLTYMVDGKVYKTEGYLFDAEITPENEPEKEGYTFSGWSEIPSKMPAKDVVVEGTFEVNYYNLYYCYNGEIVNIATLAYGEEIPEYKYVPESDERYTYTFVEWQQDGVSFTKHTMPSTDITLDAVVDVVDEIRAITLAELTSKAKVFDLTGRKVDTMVKGRMYIVNGKKCLYK